MLLLNCCCGMPRRAFSMAGAIDQAVDTNTRANGSSLDHKIKQRLSKKAGKPKKVSRKSMLLTYSPSSPLEAHCSDLKPPISQD